jgi:uncharacterized protein (TIGR00251 family)
VVSAGSSWLRERDGAVRIAVRVVPRAHRDAIVGVQGDALRVSLAAAPVDGAANAALVQLVARALGVPRSAVAIVQGERGRQKVLEVQGVDAATVRARIAAG